MSKKSARELAARIVAMRSFKGAPNPHCATCGGSGAYEYESPHNGDFREARCDCIDRDRPEVTVHEWADDLLVLAKAFLAAEKKDAPDRTARLVAALRGLVSAVSAQLARGEDTTPGDFERAWREACDVLKEFE